MKYLWLILLLSVGAMAQTTTTVSINPVADTDGTVWQTASYSITLTNPPGVNGPPFLVNGTTTIVPIQNVFGQLTASGTASGIVLVSNTAIAPAGTVWQFTICPLATSPCYTTQVAITGASQAVTITPPAIRINLAGIPYRVAAYTDNELVGAVFGNLYYNVVEPSLRVCEGNISVCVWQDVAANANGFCGSPIQPGIPYWNGSACLINTVANFDGVSLWTFENISTNSLTTSGNGGVVNFKLQTAPVSVPSGTISMFGNSATGAVDCLNNALAHCLGATQTIALGTVTMPTAGLTSGGCSATQTVAATGALTTDVIAATPNVDPTGVSGYGPSASGSLYIQAWPTANNVNFKVCNNTSGTITPAALTLNWKVLR
jgi:hypothetical protein